MNKSLNIGYGLTNPLDELAPNPIIALRAPTANDKGYPLGQTWVDKPNNKSYILTSVVANVPNWALTASGTSDLETLTGNTGGAISPTAGGNISVLGGSGISVAGTSNTLTVTPTPANFGTATLVAGTVTVANTLAASTSKIFLSRHSVGATGDNPLGQLVVGTITNGVSFVINAATTASSTTIVTTDVSVVDYWIVNV